MLDPERRLVGVTPRGPLSLPPGGAHWYVVRQVGFPDPATFGPTFELASRWLDDLAAETGIPPERTVLGGFSQGAVMAHSLGLGTGRPRPAGIVALSGFIPVVEGFEADLSPPLPPVAIGHGTLDPVISVEFGRRARAILEEAGADVLYRESPIPHTIDPRFLDGARGLGAGRRRPRPGRRRAVNANGEEFCLHFQQAVELIGRRWCGTIARALLPGPRRFTELRRAIPEISDRALSQRLRELEAEGVVIRRVSTGPPVEVAYELSAKGRDLEQVIDGVERWAHEWLAGSSPHHTYERAHP